MTSPFRTDQARIPRVVAPKGHNCILLTAARDGKMPLLQAIHDHEARLITYGFDAVIMSRQRMDGNAAIHKPVIGRGVLAGMRTSMRMYVVNHLPPLKRRMAGTQARERGAGRED